MVTLYGFGILCRFGCFSCQSGWGWLQQQIALSFYWQSSSFCTVLAMTPFHRRPFFGCLVRDKGDMNTGCFTLPPECKNVNEAPSAYISLVRAIVGPCMKSTGWAYLTCSRESVSPVDTCVSLWSGGTCKLMTSLHPLASCTSKTLRHIPHAGAEHMMATEEGSS